MLLDYRIPLPREKERAISENHTRLRFEAHPSVLCQSTEQPHAMVCGRYCEIDEHDRVARVLMSTPRTIPGQLLERGWNSVWISFDVEPNSFQDSGNNIVDISSHHISAGVCDSLVPLRDIFRSKFFPVLLENSYTSFPLVDLFAPAKCQCCLHGGRVIFRQLRTLEFTSRFNQVNI